MKSKESLESFVFCWLKPAVFEIFAYVRCDHGAIDLGLFPGGGHDSKRMKSSRSYILLQFPKGEKMPRYSKRFQKDRILPKQMQNKSVNHRLTILLLCGGLCFKWLYR